MGFCFFNNAGVAAQHAIDRGDADRVAVFDWDVHHGNGTQDVFYDREDVFYASVHEEGLYPGTGAVAETGAGAAEGTTLNIPLQAGAGDGAYAAVVDDLLGPALAGFDPDLLLISAGFDAHEHDPISRMQVSSEGYGILADRVRDVATRYDAGLGFVLEGGYSLDMLAEGIGTVHEVFHGRKPIDPDRSLDSDIAARFDAIRERHGI
jgi:acetoin utilization deacetylase AcuC-like enzyme